MEPWEWDAVREQAAVALADGREPDHAIAARLGIDRGSLWRWRKRPEFAARIEELRAPIRELALRSGLARKGERLAALQELWDRLQLVIRARAEGRSVPDKEGGASGLVCRDVKLIGKGEDAREVDIYRVDTALTRELRETLRQFAQEAGDWVERHEHSGPGGAPIPLVGMSYEELRRLPADELVRLHTEALAKVAGGGE